MAAGVFLSAGACRASLGTFPAVCRGLWRLGVDDATLDAVMAHDNRRGAPPRRYSGDHRCHRRSTLQHSPACLDCHALLAVPSREGFGQQCSAISAHPQRNSCACMWRHESTRGRSASCWNYRGHELPCSIMQSLEQQTLPSLRRRLRASWSATTPHRPCSPKKRCALNAIRELLRLHDLVVVDPIPDSRFVVTVRSACPRGQRQSLLFFRNMPRSSSWTVRTKSASSSGLGSVLLL